MFCFKCGTEFCLFYWMPILKCLKWYYAQFSLQKLCTDSAGKKDEILRERTQNISYTVYMQLVINSSDFFGRTYFSCYQYILPVNRNLMKLFLNQDFM